MSNTFNYDRQVHGLGRLTLLVAVGLSFLPFLYLMMTNDITLPAEAVIAGVIGVWSAFAVAYFVEPLSFFPTLGTAGTYMSFLSGNIGSMRVPAARAVKDVIGVEDGTPEAELVAVCAIGGSVFLNIAILTITAVAGALILSALPAAVLNAIAAYVLSGVFGAVLAMFARGRLIVAVPTLAFALLLNHLTRLGLIPLIISRFNILLCVIAGILIARAMYKRGKVK